MKYLLLLPIRLYQLCIRPFIGTTCRFYPSCSEYAHEAIKEKGLLQGTWMMMKRLLKCHPWHPGGYDPVDKV